MTEEKTKAYIIEDKWNSEGCCVVWATNSNKAKSIANYYDLFDTCYYTELRAKRAPQYDKYAESKNIIDATWFSIDDLTFFVAENEKGQPWLKIYKDKLMIAAIYAIEDKKEK